MAAAGAGAGLGPASARCSLTPRDLLAGVALGLAGAAAAAAYGGSAVGDDTFIYMRYVENHLAGHGFVYNAGEPSFGLTSPAWAFVMSGVTRFSGNVLPAWRMTALALFGAAGMLLFLGLVRRGLGYGWAGSLAALVLLEPHTFRWASSGMENALALFALSLLAMASTSASPPWVGLATLLALHPFVRPELALLSLGLGGWLLASPPREISRRRFVATMLATGVVAAALVFLAFGHFIPQTAAAKALALRQQHAGYALRQSLAILMSGALATLPIMLLSGSGRAVSMWRNVSAFAVAGVVAYLALRNHLVSTRYAAALSLPIVLSAVLIVAERARARGRLPVWVRAALAVQLVASGALLAYVFPATRTAGHEAIRGIAERLGAERPDCRVALSEIGAFGFYSRCYVIDLVGLTDRQTLDWIREGGRPRPGSKAFERLLVARRATHFVDSSSNPRPIETGSVRLTPISEQRVRRNIFSQGRVHEGLWRVYRVDPASEDAATPEGRDSSSDSASLELSGISAPRLVR